MAIVGRQRRELRDRLVTAMMANPFFFQNEFHGPEADCEEIIEHANIMIELLERENDE
jgi:hypothetical protein